MLSNHDNERHRTRCGGSLRRANAAAVLLLTLRGNPDAVVAGEDRVDPGGRDGARAPVPWLTAPPHGWDGPWPWLPFPPDASALSAESATGNAVSTPHLYRRLIAERLRSPALGRGDWEELDTSPDVLAYTPLRQRRTSDRRQLR